MKTAALPLVWVEPQLRADLESVRGEGETLSEFVEGSVRGAVEYRRMQQEFQVRADAALDRFQRTGAGRAAEEVITDMQARLDARRSELLGKHKPAA